LPGNKELLVQAPERSVGEDQHDITRLRLRGQQFQPAALDKLRWLRRKVGPEVLLSVDGGVGSDTISRCAAAGAQLLVVGTALLGQKDYRLRLAELASLAASRDDVQV
jgi:pentose-5-phosphate-3-epimerase